MITSFAEAVELAEKAVGPLLTQSVTPQEWLVASDAIEDRLGPNEFSDRFRRAADRLDGGRGLVFCYESYFASGVAGCMVPTREEFGRAGLWYDDPLKEVGLYDWNKGGLGPKWHVGAGSGGVWQQGWRDEEIEALRALPKDVEGRGPAVFLSYFERLSKCT